MKKMILVGIFAAAMAFVEAAVVFYLRKLYYPDNLLFNPSVSAVSLPSLVLIIEWVREICTIIMLFVIAFLAGQKFQGKFAYFLYSFAVWDIFYYVWLKVLLDWPASFLTWDVLFLIPVSWVSPVLAPILVSVTMIVIAFVLLKYPQEKVKFREWLLLISAAILVYASFVWDYSLLILKKGFLVKFSQLAVSVNLNPSLPKIISQYVPTAYHWSLFAFAEILAIAAIISFYRRARKSL